MTPVTLEGTQELMRQREVAVILATGGMGLVRAAYRASFVKLLQYMNDHLTDEISLNALAETAGMSRHHFCRTFKKHMGSTPMQTLHFMRVERAKNLIRSGHYTISMVAMESGFNDIGTFMRHFKKITGITATDFRNTFRPKN